jgi:TM2 domain-containing membrane protein YozV
MKKLVTSRLELLLAMLVILVSSCSTNATFTKRYHSRGFNIAWGGGGSNANNNVVKQTSKKVKAKSDMVKVAQNTESLALQSVNSAENAIVNPANQNPELYSNSVMNQNGKASVKNYFKSTSEVVKSSNSLTKTVKANVVSKPIVKANQKKYDPRNGRSWGAAILICLVLGMFGMHRFYLGYKKLGLIQLVFGALYFFTPLWWTGLIVIWVIIDLVRIFTKDLEPKDGYYTEPSE